MAELRQGRQDLPPDEASPSIPCNVVPMFSSLTEACGPNDDWTGVQERAQRRKIQNRLNVRAHRKRKAHEAGNLLDNVLASRRRNPRVGRASADESDAVATGSLAPDQSQAAVDQKKQTRLAIFAHLRSNRGLGELKTRFPLSSDHLIPLIQYNTFRAVLTNVHILYVFDLILQPFLNSKCISKASRCTPSANQSGQEPPETLKPTLLQRTTPHASWIDTLPLAKMRDNAVVLESSLDFRELQVDCFGPMCHHGVESSGETGVIAWSDPWHPRGWELTGGFIRKWKTLLEGCDEIIEATNYWRGIRGEEPLVFDEP